MNEQNEQIMIKSTQFIIELVFFFKLNKPPIFYSIGEENKIVQSHFLPILDKRARNPKIKKSRPSLKAT